VALALNPANFAQGDRLVVTGALTGTHVAVLSLAAGVNVNDAVAHVGDHTYVSVGAGTSGGGTVTGVLADLGARDYQLTWDDSRSGYVLRAQDDHYSGTAQALLNSAGAVSIAWFSQLDNLTKRLGDLHLSAARTSKPASSAAGGDASAVNAPAATLSNAFWIRANAQRVNADLGIPGVSGFREYQYGVDAGYDRLVSPAGSDAQLYLGAFAAFQSGHRSFLSGHGKGDTDSAAVGAYATWLHRDGWFLDGVVKGQYFDSDYDVGGAGLGWAGHGEFRNYGFGASLEFGRRFEFGKAGFVEPGLEISYAHIFAEDYTVNSGLRVAVGDSDLFRYSLGVRVGWVFDFGSQGALSPYVKAGVERLDSLGGSVRAVSERWQPDLDEVRGRVGFGLSWQLDARQQLHFDYEADFGSHYRKPWSLNVGYRVQF
jgi:outer membrane autotransporter protein